MPVIKAVIQFVRSGAWCKGSTPAFGAVDLGSNPGAPAKSSAYAALGK